MDILTVAYMAIGAHTALREATPEQIGALNDRQSGGEESSIQSVIDHAAMVDSLFDLHGYEDGVWYYDVAEPVGHWIALRRLAGDEPSANDVRQYALSQMGVSE